MKALTAARIVFFLSLMMLGTNPLTARHRTPSKDTPEITPESFGCVGNGFVDDTKALQEAFDYCMTHNRMLRSQKGKTYAVSKTIMVHTKSDFQIDFGGAVIKAIRPLECIIDFDNYDVPDKTGHSSTVYNLVLDCNSRSGGVKCSRAAKISFNSLMVRNCSQKAFRVMKGYEVFVTNSHIHCTTGPESYGIYMDTGDCHFDNIVIIDAHTGIFQRTSINFYDKIHCWLSHNVEGSSFVHIAGGLAHFEQSYCDTAEKGYIIAGPCVLRLIGCYYFNNPECYDSKNSPVIFYFTKAWMTTQATISLEGSGFEPGGLDVSISNYENHHIQFDHCYINSKIKGNAGKFSLTAAQGVTFRRAFGIMGDNTLFSPPVSDANRIVVDADLDVPAEGTVVVGTVPKAFAPSTDQYGLSILIDSEDSSLSLPVKVAPSGEVSFQCPPNRKPVRIILDMEYTQK